MFVMSSLPLVSSSCAPMILPEVVTRYRIFPYTPAEIWEILIYTAHAATGSDDSAAYLRSRSSVVGEAAGIESKQDEESVGILFLKN